MTTNQLTPPPPPSGFYCGQRYNFFYLPLGKVWALLTLTLPKKSLKPLRFFKAWSLTNRGKASGIVWKIGPRVVPQVIRLSLGTSQGKIYQDNACGFPTVCPSLQKDLFLFVLWREPVSSIEGLKSLQISVYKELVTQSALSPSLEMSILALWASGKVSPKKYDYFWPQNPSFRHEPTFIFS